MVEKEVTIVPEEGLHARPAAEFVKEAKSYNSDIKVIKGDKEANAKSSLSLMSLGAAQGDNLTIRAEGEDAEAAAEALADLISNAEH
ncbi:MAG: HPr family phosphocarrier protein [Rubrobacteraceae bacterium]